MTSKKIADRTAPYNKDARPNLKKARESTLGTGIRKPIPHNRPVPSTNEHMKVFVRVRPFNSREQAVGCRRTVIVENDKFLTFDPKEQNDVFFFKGTAQRGRDLTKKVNKDLLFEFTRVFDENTSNEVVFEETAKSIVRSLLEGYNCSIFAYGATGAGKTFTMLGTPDNPGINHKTIVELLGEVQNLKSLNECEVTMGVTYIEVYNENVRDLLHPETGMLQLREDNGRVAVAGLKIEQIDSVETEVLFDLLNRGNQNRTQHPTDANAESSRSHAVFQVHVRVANKGDVKMSKLSMIDLAGSERAADNGCKGMRFKEGSNINKSLLALGNCINALADGLRHVPYRDSKLTRLLKDSLGGNCRTMMIANVSSSSLAYEDTYNTLKYASRAKSIKSKITRNMMTEKFSQAKFAQALERVKTLEEQLARALSNPSNITSLPNLEEWETKIAGVMEAKKQTVTEMLSLQTEQLMMEWRLKYKCYAQPYLDNVKDDDAVTRSQVSIDQLTGRLEAVRRRQEEYKPVLAEIQEREEALEQEIRAHPLAAWLLKELEVQRGKIKEEENKLCGEHEYRIVRLQEQQLNRYLAANSKIVTTAEEMCNLLRAYGYLTKDLDHRYQEAVKMLDGSKSVTFSDNENTLALEHYKLLRLSMGRVHQKQVVTDEEMDDHKKRFQSFQPLQERPQNRVTIIAPVSKITLPRTPVAKSVHLGNKENAGANISQQHSLPRGTPGMKALAQRAISRNPLTVRMHPYRNRVTKSTPKPIRMNKLAAARMAAAVR